MKEWRKPDLESRTGLALPAVWCGQKIGARWPRNEMATADPLSLCLLITLFRATALRRMAVVAS